MASLMTYRSCKVRMLSCEKGSTRSGSVRDTIVKAAIVAFNVVHMDVR